MCGPIRSGLVIDAVFSRSFGTRERVYGTNEELWEKGWMTLLREEGILQVTFNGGLQIRRLEMIEIDFEVELLLILNCSF